jgi:hypothetical protein
MPTNATFVSASLSGGQGYSGTATVTESSGVIDFAISGSTPALGTVDYPIITVTMNATGPSGAHIETSVAGSSYADPGFSFVSGTQIGSVGTVCFPYAPAPVFSTTQIVGGPPAPEPATGCYPGSGDWLFGTGTASMSYEGPMNTVDNSSLYLTFDGTCSGDPFAATTVYGPDTATADALCLSLVGTPVNSYQPFGPEFFLCTRPE